MSDEIVKLAVLEQKFVDFSNVVSKIDYAITKMSDVNVNITKMLAVHEERIEQCNKSDLLIIRMIDGFKEETYKKDDDMNKRILAIEDQLEEVSRIKWITVGTGIVLAVLAAAFSTLASGWWTPSEMQMQNRERTYQSTAIEK